MKKHLIAAAVAAAVVAPAAMAQNVTVYGIIDAGIQSYDNGTSSLTRAANNALASSRLGFRGTEDLGGGLKANFQLEAALIPNDGVMGNGTTSTAGASSFNRESWVGLSGGFGEIRLGRQDVTYAQDIDSGVSQAGNLNLSAGIGGKNGELGGDQNNVIKYISPTFSGFSFNLGYASGNSSSQQTDLDAKQTGAFVQYAAGPLKLMAGYQKNEALASADEQDFTRFGASYDFGVVSVGGFMTKSDNNLAGDVKINQVNAKVPLGSGLALHAVYATAKIDGVTDAKGDGYILAITKALSKRTTIYGAYTDVSNDPAGTMTMTGVSAEAVGKDPSAVTLGIVHSF